MKKLTTLILSLIIAIAVFGQQERTEKPRILISTDIGGTDPDDNQSMIHLLMNNDRFDIEGLVSSPSFGNGSKDEILRMISLYEKDYPKLIKNNPKLMKPSELRKLCVQGRKGQASYKGYGLPTEGSRWIAKCAHANDERPLYILVWGTTDDLAQALHDNPDIEDRIKVYYIGGPNKKWGINSYAYIAENFPQLYMIENNASYRGFITDNNRKEVIEGVDPKIKAGYYNKYIANRGAMGKAFKDWYNGEIKMGDTPSLLYLMDGNPANPKKECWGGSFEKTRRSSRYVFNYPLHSDRDSVSIYSIVEFQLSGPWKDNIESDSVCFTLTVDNQTWNGYYLGRGTYAVRYSPKAPGVLTYTISSKIPELDGQKGSFSVYNRWPGDVSEYDYSLGEHWFTDKSDASLFEGKWQGAKTISKWRPAILKDWASRWDWLK